MGGRLLSLTECSGSVGEEFGVEGAMARSSRQPLTTAARTRIRTIERASEGESCQTVLSLRFSARGLGKIPAPTAAGHGLRSRTQTTMPENARHRADSDLSPHGLLAQPPRIRILAVLSAHSQMFLRSLRQRDSLRRLSLRPPARGLSEPLPSCEIVHFSPNCTYRRRRRSGLDIGTRSR